MSEYQKYLEPEEQGFMDLAALNAGKFIGGREAQSLREETLGSFSDDSQAYGLLMSQQAMNQEQFASRLAANNERLNSIRLGSQSAPSKASSMREYQQLARQSLEGTARYLRELESFKAPTAPDIDFTFENPITGETLQYGTTFDDVYSGGFDPRAEAEKAVLGRFNRTKKRELDTFLNAVGEEVGRTADFLAPLQQQLDSSANGMIEVRNDRNQAKSFDNAVSAFRYMNTTHHGNLTNYYQQFEKAQKLEAEGERYAEARALAKLGAIDDVTYFGNKSAQGASFFMNADVNAVLDSMIGNTEERMEIARLTNENDFRAEFDRRSQQAASQRSRFDAQLRANQAQEEAIALETQKTRQLMEEQQREYSQALSSFGSSSSSSDGDRITFTDTRPM